MGFWRRIGPSTEEHGFICAFNVGRMLLFPSANGFLFSVKPRNAKTLLTFWTTARIVDPLACRDEWPRSLDLLASAMSADAICLD